MANRSINDVVCEASRTWVHNLHARKKVRQIEVSSPRLLSVAMMVTQVSNLHFKSWSAGTIFKFWHWNQNKISKKWINQLLQLPKSKMQAMYIKVNFDLKSPENLSFCLYKVCRLGWAPWNLSCFEFKFDDTRLSS